MANTFKVKFLGAAETVTGSSYLVECLRDGEVEATIMVDHGMFQGRDIENRNALPYDFSPESIDYLILTHAHIDHSGLIPKLVNRGFQGKLLCTKETAELISLLLLDSANVQDKNYQSLGSIPLYTAQDVYNALDLIEIVDFKTKYELELSTGKQGLSVELFRAGHILGAASIVINYESRSLSFSGDIGRTSQDVVRGFDPVVKQSEYIIMESLYGGKFHQEKDLMLKKFADEINNVLKRNGNVIIPAFAVQRTQEMLFILNKLIKEGQIDKDANIYIDSPLASRVSHVYTDNIHEVYSSNKKLPGKLTSYMYTANVKSVKSYRESKKIKKAKKSIIISGSGMCNGGRVIGYLKAMIEDSKNMVAIVGFQAEDTLGRELVSGSKHVVIDGETYSVNADIMQFEGFSAHADQEGLFAWLSTFTKASVKKVILVHAEVEQAQSYSDFLTKQGYVTMIPGYKEEISL
jgi:metallo-beta-lactamase family protein